MHFGRFLLMPAMAALPAMAADAPFRDVSAGSGLRFELVSGSAEKPYILESMTGGVAFLDYDDDGQIDIYFVNGGTLDAPSGDAPRPSDRLYRNNGDGTFDDVTEAAGLGDSSWGMGVAVADVDNNGYDDIFVTNYGPNHLFLNRGDGTFQSAAAELEGNEWSSSASFGDYDADGDVDLYVANYLEFDPNDLPQASQLCRYRGIPVQCGPRGMTPTADRLYENVGGGRFRDATSESGIASVPAAYGLGVVWTDFDDDGDQDVYVANDSTANYLFQNNGDGTFGEIALLAGMALSADGKEQAGMGLDFGDFDNDALVDLIVTNFSDDYNTLYRNVGDNVFRDVSAIAGLAEPTWPKLSWGVRFVDFNLDGFLDIVIADGHVYPEVDRHDFGIRYRQPNSAFRNVGDGAFEHIELPAGSMGPHSSRGLAAGDYDNDGRIDLVIANLDAPPTLLKGIAATGNWLLIDLQGTTSNRSAIGARVTVVASNLRQVREVRSGGSYQSSNDRRLHFGLGDYESADSVTIRWPSGTEQVLQGVAANQVLRIDEPARSKLASPR